MRVTHMKIPWIFPRFPQFKGKNYYFLALEMISSHTTNPTNNIPGQKKICRAHSCGSQNLGMLCSCHEAGHIPCWFQGRIAFPLPLAAAAPMSLLLPSGLPRWGSPPRPSCRDLPPPGRAQSARTG